MSERRGIGPSMIVAIVALFLALGGVGYTASRLPRGSVGAPQLRDGAVRETKLAAGAVTSGKVRDGSLTAADLKLETLGKVPLAASADRAAVADAVAGQQVRGVASTVGLGARSRVVGGDPGLEVHADCGPTGTLRLFAASTLDHGIFRGSVVTAGDGDGRTVVVEDSDFGAGEELTLAQGASRGTAQLVYLAPDGHVTSVVLSFAGLTGTQTCTVVGTLLRT